MNASAFWRSIPAGSSAKVQLGGASGNLELHGVCLQSGEEAVLMCKWGSQAVPLRLCRVASAEPYCTVHLRLDEEVEFLCSGGDVSVNGVLFKSSGGSRKRVRPTEKAEAKTTSEPAAKAAKASLATAPEPAAAKAKPKAEPKAEPKAGASKPAAAAVGKAMIGPMPVDPRVAAQKEARDREAAAAVAAGQRAAKEVAAKAAASAPAPQQSQKRTLKGGVTYELLKAGKGPPAVSGRRVKVKYDGRLAKNGKRFDKGSIAFKLGAGEVISGWDEGVKGMLCGEQRRLLIPPAMGYGARGAPPDIPPNAALTFEVELLQC